MQGRYASDNGATSLPFSDYHNPNEPPRLPLPNHGDVACLVDIGGAMSIRDWEATKIVSEWTPYYNEETEEIHCICLK